MRRVDSLEKTLILGGIGRQEEKGTTEDEMAGWHHWLDGHEFEWTPGVDDGQGGLRAAIQGVAKSQTWLNDWTELNWQYTALTYSFPNLEPVRCSMSSSNCCFLTYIQISQEASKVVWYSHLLKNFPHKGFGIVNKAGIDVFLEPSLFQWSKRCWQFDLWFLCLF